MSEKETIEEAKAVYAEYKASSLTKRRLEVRLACAVTSLLNIIDAKGWNDNMDEAPKDGSRILGLPENRRCQAVEVHWGMFANKWINNYTEGEWIITHWMPLPTLPNQNITESKDNE